MNVTTEATFSGGDGFPRAQPRRVSKFGGCHLSTSSGTQLSSGRARRASDRGLLPMTLESYLALLDWTGRQLRGGTRGVIPLALASILDRLQVSAESWLETIARFGRQFHRAVGLTDHLKVEARRLGVNRLHGLRWSQVAFAHSPCP